MTASRSAEPSSDASSISAQPPTWLLNQAEGISEHPDVAVTLGNLGTVEEQVGSPRRGARLSSARSVSSRQSTPEHPAVAMTLVHLGKALRDLGDADEAVGLQERALAIGTAVYGPAHHEVAATKAELARSRRSLGET